MVNADTLESECLTEAELQIVQVVHQALGDDYQRCPYDLLVPTVRGLANDDLTAPQIADKIRDMVRWREKIKADSLLHDMHDNDDMWQLGLLGFSESGRAVFYMRVGAITTSAGMQSLLKVDGEEHCRVFARRFELGRVLMLRTSASKRVRMYKQYLVLDLQDISLLKAYGVKEVARYLSILSDMYNETVYKILVVNAPRCNLGGFLFTMHDTASCVPCRRPMVLHCFHVF